MHPSCGDCYIQPVWSSLQPGVRTHPVGTAIYSLYGLVSSLVYAPILWGLLYTACMVLSPAWCTHPSCGDCYIQPVWSCLQPGVRTHPVGTAIYSLYGLVSSLVYAPILWGLLYTACMVLSPAWCTHPSCGDCYIQPVWSSLQPGVRTHPVGTAIYSLYGLVSSLVYAPILWGLLYTACMVLSPAWGMHPSCGDCYIQPVWSSLQPGVCTHPVGTAIYSLYGLVSSLGYAPILWGLLYTARTV